MLSFTKEDLGLLPFKVFLLVALRVVALPTFMLNGALIQKYFLPLLLFVIINCLIVNVSLMTCFSYGKVPTVFFPCF